MSIATSPPAMTFEELFGRPFTIAARAPGRVNLIGEHTDYNSGFVLPTTIPQLTIVQLAPSDGDVVRAWSYNTHGDAEHDQQHRGNGIDAHRAGADGIGGNGSHSGGGLSYRLGEERQRHDWLDFIQGITQTLRSENHRISGFDVRIESTVPMGSGLSSSAALEIALLRALREAFRLPLTDTDLARLGQRAENELVGAPVGIMDQMVCSLGQSGYALFLDTASLTYQLVPLPPSVELIVIDSQIRHQHASGEYRTRRGECEQACAALNVQSLRDVDPVTIDLADTLEALPTPLGRRARHVVNENRRVLQMVDALRHERLDECGRLLYEGHVSLRDDYEVSVPEVDALVEIAITEAGVYGARMTGGGFGGAIVALARAGAGREAGRAIARRYREDTGATASVLV
jgi:galactokinase